MKYILTIMLLFLLAASAQGATLVDSVSFGIDDVFCVTTAIDLTQVYIAPGKDENTSRDAGFRFRSFLIPHGVTIDSAFISAYAWYSNSTTTCSWVVYFEDTASADTFSTGADFQARAVTTAHVEWNPDAWTGDTRYVSPDISDVLQEVVDRADYDSLDNVVLFIKDNSSTYSATRYISAYETSASQAVQLTVYYTAGGSAPADTTNTRYRNVRVCGGKI
jgi:hypothetical protein